MHAQNAQNNNNQLRYACHTVSTCLIVKRIPFYVQFKYPNMPPFSMFRLNSYRVTRVLYLLFLRIHLSTWNKPKFLMGLVLVNLNSLCSVLPNGVYLAVSFRLQIFYLIFIYFFSSFKLFISSKGMSVSQIN